MAIPKFVVYFRVSTPRQGYWGLGLEAQREAVAKYLLGHPGKVVATFTDIQSGRKLVRPNLLEALRLCRVHSAVLVIARLDRLARNMALISRLLESQVQFVAVDFPEANRLTIHILAAIAEYESKLNSERTKAAIAAAQKRGVKFGGNITGKSHIYIKAAQIASTLAIEARVRASAANLAPTLAQLKAQGKTLHGVAVELTRMGIATPRRVPQWNRKTVARLYRLSGQEPPVRKRTGRASPRFPPATGREAGA